MTVNAITDTKKGGTGIAPTYLHTTRTGCRCHGLRVTVGFSLPGITTAHVREPGA